MLTILVPAATLLSLVPDVLLAVTRFVPGTRTAAVALMLMHLAIVAIAVPAYSMASRGSARADERIRSER